MLKPSNANIIIPSVCHKSLLIDEIEVNENHIFQESKNVMDDLYEKIRELLKLASPGNKI